MLRVEVIAHDVKGLRCGKVVDKLPIMLATLQRMVMDFLNVVQAAHRSYLPDGVLDALVQPRQRGQRRLAGVDLQKPRMRIISEAVVALAPKPDGFTAAELAAKVRKLLPPGELTYLPRHASYDISKLRGKELVERIDTTRRYRVHASRHSYLGWEKTEFVVCIKNEGYPASLELHKSTESSQTRTPRLTVTSG